MAHTYALQLIHCVFSTKGRVALIHDPSRLWTYLRSRQKHRRTRNRHRRNEHSRTHSVDRASHVANRRRHSHSEGKLIALDERNWDAAISVSPSQIPMVVRYIEHQAEHHRTRSFEDEYETLLQKSGVSFDRNYLF
jgi:IS30 family transposase